MGLDLDITYHNEFQKNQKIFDSFEYEIDECSVSLEYRLNIMDIHNEQLFFNNLNCTNVLSLLTYSSWEGFNAEEFLITNKGMYLLFEKVDYDSNKKIIQLSNEELKLFKSDIYKIYDEVKLFLKFESDNYIAKKSLLVLIMLKELIENKGASLYSSFA